MPTPFDTDSYRYPYEHLVLFVTFVLVLIVIAVTSAATVCGSALFVLIMLVSSYFASTSKHNQLISQAHHVTPAFSPDLNDIVADCIARLRPGPVQAFVVPARVLNAYTFGLSNPKVVVLYSGLIQVMEANEIKFIVGHEIGHVRLGHTWLNSLVGGMAGIPSPFGAAVILRLTLLFWNRMCEYSADRAGLLACGDVDKAISALVKIETGGRYTAADHGRTLQPLNTQDAFVEEFGDLFSTHPGISRRVDALRKYAASSEYQTLQARIAQNSFA
jgi:Zn-dependent protease with chaperone function